MNYLVKSTLLMLAMLFSLGSHASIDGEDGLVKVNKTKLTKNTKLSVYSQYIIDSFRDGGEGTYEHTPEEFMTEIRQLSTTERSKLPLKVKDIFTKKEHSEFKAYLLARFEKDLNKKIETLNPDTLVADVKSLPKYFRRFIIIR